ncbi:InlB B-repeat-containing protein [Bifidobacterium thermophilum]|nr:InlB B-repeat-containing protein [Bifidobacterium thermophilum]
MLLSGALLTVPFSAVPANADTQFIEQQTSSGQTRSRNNWKNEYSPEGGGNWAYTVDSAIEHRSDGGYDRIEWTDDKLVVEQYNSSFVFMNAKTISASTYTPTDATEVLWGGYFNGSNYRFVVTGQSNPNESDSVAVVRVTKYSKSWQYLGNVEYSGINTYIPFDGGSLRMTEANGELWIRTCHEMYNIKGVHHQANMTFRIRESDLAKLGQATAIQNYQQSAMGYVSHSFNQYIVAAGGKIYGADHGDANPRQITIKDITPTANDDAWRSDGQILPVMTFKGTDGDNFTGATFDGFESASNGKSLIAAGTIADQDKSFPASGSEVETGARNVWVSVVPTDGSTVTTKTLTSNAFDGNQTATDPVLVKISERRFLIMWSSYDKTDEQKQTHGNISYAFMDTAGNLTSKIYTMKGVLSDCKPIVVGNTVVWYSTGTAKNTGWTTTYHNKEAGEAIEDSKNSAPVFYTINTSTGQSSSHDSTVAYRMYFLANGGSPSKVVETKAGAKATAPTSPTRTNYTFSGWSTNEHSYVAYDFNTPVKSDTILYAYWTPQEHTIYFDANGGTTYETSRSVPYSWTTYNFPDATRPGYTFAGWYTAPTGGTKIGSTYTMGSSDVTFYAHWQANSYTVTFDANGGSTSVTSKTVTEGQPYGELPTPTRVGYTFAGWWEQAWQENHCKYHDGKKITSSTPYEIPQDSTLVADWNISTYTVSFDSVGGSSVPSQTVEYGSKVSRPKDPVRAGYAFQGWYTARSGGSKYDFGKPVTGGLTLYARWRANVYTLSFDANGGSVSPGSKSVTYGGAYGQLPTPSRKGYTFQGWYTAKNGGSKISANTVTTGNATVYAHWTANSYKVTFNANGGSVQTTSKTVTQDQPYGTLPTPARAGHYLLAAGIRRSSGGLRVTASTVFTAGAAQTLFAHWDTISFAVLFDSAGGSSVASQTVEYGSKAASPKDPVRAGYAFQGWYTARSGGSKYDFGKPVTGGLTLYARWKANVYTLSFDANGGSVSPGSKSVAYGGAYGQLPTPSRKGYTFQGWYTAKSGGSRVTAGTVMGDRDVKVYARWVSASTPVKPTTPSKPTTPVKPTTPSKPAVSTVVMFRLYNRFTGEHFYTSSLVERDSLVKVGWRSEGTGWVAPVSGKPVYRLYNPYVAGGDHHYTMSTKERDALVKAGWRAEGIGWYSGGSVRVLREYNPYARTGTHNYTTDPKEDTALVKAGWRAEGTGWYAVKAK